jgi:hypothetical protein
VGDEPQVPRVVKLTVKDRAALRAQLLAWAELPSLARVLVSHGLPIVGDQARNDLRKMAQSLA